MAMPSDKSPELAKLLDDISSMVYGRVRHDIIDKDICLICGMDATAFRDTLSRKEYTISGMCQKCQDKIF